MLEQDVDPNPDSVIHGLMAGSVRHIVWYASSDHVSQALAKELIARSTASNGVSGEHNTISMLSIFLRYAFEGKVPEL